MFNVAEIKNANRHRVSDKTQPMPLEELFEEWPEDQKPMPYFSVVPEQIKKDKRYQALSEVEQGRFLRLCVLIAGAGERGRYVNHSVMAKRLNISLEVWEQFQNNLLTAGLLIGSPDGDYIIQPELREQCLQYARKKQG